MSVPDALLGSGPRSAKSFATTLDRVTLRTKFPSPTPEDAEHPGVQSEEPLTGGSTSKFHKQLRVREADRGCP